VILAVNPNKGTCRVASLTEWNRGVESLFPRDQNNGSALIEKDNPAVEDSAESDGQSDDDFEDVSEERGREEEYSSSEESS
jgi:hypothetical protein